MHKPGSRGDFAGPRDGPNPADEYDGEEKDETFDMDLEELKQRHDPNDESHRDKIGVCFYCLMLEQAEKGTKHD